MDLVNQLIQTGVVAHPGVCCGRCGGRIEHRDEFGRVERVCKDCRRR